MKKYLFPGLVITLVCMTALIGNHTDWVVHHGAYQNLAEHYGRFRLPGQDSEIVYNPGLRKLPQAEKTLDVCTVLPGQDQSYPQQMQDFMNSGAKMIVECSGLDSWHTSREGSAWLPALRSQAYRAVIFDGGHHLPTLGMAPDIIIVPVFQGYAVHGYMRDGMRADKILEILSSNQIPIVMATVSRWRLVKTEDSLRGISREVMDQLEPAAEGSRLFTADCCPRISKYKGRLFIYANDEYIKQPHLVSKYCLQLGLEDVSGAYIAFNYDAITPAQAHRYALKLQKKLGVRMEIVNQPVKVSNLLFHAAGF